MQNPTAQNLLSPQGLLSLLSSPLIWRGDSLARQPEAERTGFAALDALLPGNGWPRGALTELLHDADGMGELSLLMPTLARLSLKSRIAFVAPPHVPYAPALVHAGINLAQLVVLQPATDTEAWWSAEQLLRSQQFRAVLFWPDRFDERALRRLQAASEIGKCCGFVFHDDACAPHASPAPLRIRLSPAKQDRAVQLCIIKRRGSLIATPLTLTLAPAPMPVSIPLPAISKTRGMRAGERVVESSRSRSEYTARAGEDIRATMRRRPLSASSSSLSSLSSLSPQLTSPSRTQRTAQPSARWPLMAASADTLKLSTAPDR